MPCYDIIISMDGIMLTTKVPNVPNTIFYAFGEGEMKRDLFFKLLGISLHIEEGDSCKFENLVVEAETQEILVFFVRTNLTEEEKLKTLVGQYLHEDLSREQFEQEIIPHRVAEKLSQ